MLITNSFIFKFEMNNQHVNIFGQPFYVARRIAVQEMRRNRVQPANLEVEVRRILRLAVMTAGGAGVVSTLAVQALQQKIRKYLDSLPQRPQYTTPDKKQSRKEVPKISAQKQKQLRGSVVEVEPDGTVKQLFQGMSFYNLLCYEEDENLKIILMKM